MIKKIAHLADIHIRKSTRRNDEYEFVFNKLIKSLEKEKPDRIVIVGDLVNDYLDLQGEQIILVSKLLNRLSNIAKVVITRGNHDFRSKDSKRVDSVGAIVEVINNPNIVYYNETGVFYDDNVAWMVWHHGDKKNNPWSIKEGKIVKDNNDLIKIDLFHDPVNGSKNNDGFEFKSKSYYSIKDFKGDYSFFGDIHVKQYLDKNNKKAYAGSLIAQTFAEGDDNFHGYLLWDIENGGVEEIDVENEHSFKNITITPFTDFDELDIEIENPTKYMKVRFIWKTLPHTRNPENERKLRKYIFDKYDNIIIHNKNEFIEEDKVDIVEETTIKNINEKSVQEDIIREYLDKIGVENDIIDEVILLDDEITNLIDVEELTNIEWDIIKFGGTNFMSYEKLDVDWGDKDGLFQITGINTGGKTTLLKIITYVLYNKALETEFRMKYGDSRFVNNRNNAKYTEAYAVLLANGEYFGIKRRTDLKYGKDGELNGATTSVDYFVLSTPDDDFDDENNIKSLNDDNRNKTQEKIDKIVGSYENFKRIVMTTSDTLNDTLSNNMADFIDSLLFDSGLDLFDIKLEGLKDYEKKINQKSRINCDVEKTEEKIAQLTEEIQINSNSISLFETKELPEVEKSITIGKDFIEENTKKLYKIDEDIYNLDVDNTKKIIDAHTNAISEYVVRKSVLEESISKLKDSYDEIELERLIQIKDNHRTEEYSNKLKIKEFERNIDNNKQHISIINGEIFRLREDGKELKLEIFEIKNSKNCYACGQEIKDLSHQEHIAKIVGEKETKMYDIAKQIKEKENEIPKYNKLIEEDTKSIESTNEIINIKSLELEDVLKKIGLITNDKNDFEKRKEFQNELVGIPDKIENENLKKTLLEQKITNHENSLKQIEENKKTNVIILKGKSRLEELESKKVLIIESISNHKAKINELNSEILQRQTLIKDYKEQEKRDMVISLYKKSIHRDGIPRQLLTSYVLPQINKTLNDILSVAPFKVWLDEDTLRPQLVYDNRPDSVIDCISSSGKERTFSSIVLKFALNQINVKSKPNIFLLDEVMGKLDEDSVVEFVEMLGEIKKSISKLLIIEQRINIEPDHLIEVVLDEDGISSLKLI